jgi:DNA helicase IV
MTTDLPLEAQQIISEEEALLARALEALDAAASRRGRARATQAFQHQLRELRDEAATATAYDLPTLFQEMSSIRTLAEREPERALPERATPYFAHLRLRGAGGPRDYLLGRATYVETAADLRIVDWRFAPVARIFYGYGEGDEYEETLPGGLAEGVVEARRVLVIERGVLTRIHAGSLVLVRAPGGAWTLDDGGPTSVLAGGSGTAARPGCLGVGRGSVNRRAQADVTALLSPDQFEAMSVEANRPLLVLGSAGSGKTTVALHRLAQLAFDDRDRFSSPRLRVVVPEEGLARLSRRLLAPLGLEKVRVQTLAAWLEDSARSAFHLRALPLTSDTPSLVSRLKRHPALKPLLVARVGKLHERQPKLETLRSRLAEAFSDRTFLGQVVDAAAGDLPRTAIETTARHTMLQLAAPLSKEFAGIDAERLQTVDGRSMAEGTPDALAGTLDLEDLALLLYLRARAGAVDRGIAHLVLDEAEDFSLFELHVLGRQLAAPRSITLAGDEVQQTMSGFAGWDGALAELGLEDAATCRLQTSYRCPRPVVELARKVLGTQAPASSARSGREGVPVGFHHFPDEAQAHLFLASALRDLLDRERDASVGLIASTPEVARSLHRSLSEGLGARLVLDGDFTFEPGIDVTDVDSIKGLEFDYVVLPDATASAYPDTPESRRRLHVAVTRASHQLWLLSSGRRTPVLDSPAVGS